MDVETTYEETVSLDSLFRTLGDEHRLRALVSLYLSDPDESFAADALVDVGEDRETAVAAFYHVHFPKLADMGLVEWDREAHEIRRGPAFPAVDRVLDSLVVRDDEFQAELLAHEV